MILRVDSCSSPRQAMDYLLQEKKNPFLVYSNHLDTGGTKNHITNQFEVMWKESVVNQFSHYKMSFHPSENPSNELLHRLSKEVVSDHQLKENQVLTVRHHDSSCHHVHLLANRLSFEMQMISDSHLGLRSKRLAKELEAKYQLKNIEDIKGEHVETINSIIENASDPWDMVEQMRYEGIGSWIAEEDEIFFQMKDSKIQIRIEDLPSESQELFIDNIELVQKSESVKPAEIQNHHDKKQQKSL